MRQANTTFVNLRAALDDLDPLVADSLVGTRDLAPFLRDLRSVVDPAIPVFGDLTETVARPGPNNDLTDALRTTVGAQKASRRSVGPTLTALDDAQPNIEFAVPYTPELMSFIAKLGQVTSYYDANGHYARVLPAAANLFRNNPGGDLTPIPTSAAVRPDRRAGPGPVPPLPGRLDPGQRRLALADRPSVPRRWHPGRRM